ncbi:hypothetical protein NKH34_12175 [Mesorhizobium sp. M1148]|uniref:hypothetical protein n=1 Tax=unclassified Mesorhizobium TaxID=325217 RepID=UPI00333AB719
MNAQAQLDSSYEPTQPARRIKRTLMAHTIASPATGLYVPQRVPDYVQQFYFHLEQWRDETAFSSLLDDKLQNAHFREIVNLGRAVVPLIFDELRSNQDFLFVALETLVPESDVISFKGSPSDTVEAWLRWAERSRGSY